MCQNNICQLTLCQITMDWIDIPTLYHDALIHGTLTAETWFIAIYCLLFICEFPSFYNPVYVKKYIPKETQLQNIPVNDIERVLYMTSLNPLQSSSYYIGLPVCPVSNNNRFNLTQTNSLTIIKRKIVIAICYLLCICEFS